MFATSIFIRNCRKSLSTFSQKNVRFPNFYGRNIHSCIVKFGKRENLYSNLLIKAKVKCRGIPYKSFIKLGIGFSTSAGLLLFRTRHLVHCDSSEDYYTHQEVEKKKSDPEFDWRSFWELLRRDFHLLLAAIVSSLIVAYLNIKIPIIIGQVINILAAVRGGQLRSGFLEAVAGTSTHLIGLYVLQGLFTFCYIAALSSLGERLAARLRKCLFHSILRQDIAFFDSYRTGELINRLTVDIQDFKSSFKACISQGLRSVTQIAGCLISIYLISPKMSLVMIIVLPSVVFVGNLMGSGLRKISREAQKQTSKATAIADEAFSNIRTVRSFAMECQENEIFGKEVDLASSLNQLLGLGIGLFQGLSNIALNGIVLGVLYTGGTLIEANEITPGDLMAFLVAVQTIQRSMGQLSLLFGNFMRGMTAGARVFEFIKMEPIIPIEGGSTIAYNSFKGDIEFKNVTFAYPTRPEVDVLKHFSLKIPRGKSVALVGVSGGGKSTVAALLERFYDVKRGRITIDGLDLRDLDPSWFRGNVVGFINQEPVLFATTVMENIRFGNPDATDEEVIEAAKAANAHEFIKAFPKGYDTILGERGSTVSGGQKQRIAIARALVKSPAIIIMDEATSALDSESERIVQETLDSIVEGKTVLIIAHRLSTIQDADLIAVISDGTIAEMGSHDLLKGKKGLYWNLICQQQKDSMMSKNCEEN